MSDTEARPDINHNTSPDDRAILDGIIEHLDFLASGVEDSPYGYNRNIPNSSPVYPGKQISIQPNGSEMWDIVVCEPTDLELRYETAQLMTSTESSGGRDYKFTVINEIGGYDAATKGDNYTLTQLLAVMSTDLKTLVEAKKAAQQAKPSRGWLGRFAITR